MKKRILSALFLTLSLFVILTLISCSEDTDKKNKNHSIHDFSSWKFVRNATCTNDGLQYRECNCGEKETKVVKATGHIWLDGTQNTPKTCVLCGTAVGSTDPDAPVDSFTGSGGGSGLDSGSGLEGGAADSGLEDDGETADSGTGSGGGSAHIHTYGDWIIAKEPTCTRNGYKERSCSCGFKITEDTAAKGHSYISGICSVCDSPEPEDIGLDYALSSDGSHYTVQGIGSCADTDIIIPCTYKGLLVTAIEMKAFGGCTSLTSVVIPDSVTSIGWQAFSSCTSLISIEIPDSVTRIDFEAFYNCGALTLYCEAESQPSGWVNDWNRPIVWNCKNNDVADDGYIYTVTDGIRYSIKDNIATVARQPRNIMEAIIPESITYKGASYPVTSIDDDAFYWCESLTSVVIPNGVTSIGSNVFFCCHNLTSIEIPNSVTCIGDRAFDDCSSLVSVVIPNSVTSMGEAVFTRSKSLTAYFEAENPLSGWFSEYWHIPIVWNCKNNDIADDGYIYTVTDGIRYSIKDNIATVARQPENIKEAIIPESIAYKGASYPVTCIGNDAFYDCDALTSIVIPDSVTSIGNEAFSYCMRLESIVIPNSVTSIDFEAFDYCIMLTIYCEATIKPSGWDTRWNRFDCPVVWGYVAE